MYPHVSWEQIALRLVLTVIAGGLLGAERSRTGHSAGLRTTLLVTLAAAIAMIQMNLLMDTRGKTPDSFGVMDLMRLPLGILTGVGFIGAGAIVRKQEMVLGITTAATLWFSTVVGLCLGGGQVILGSCSTAIGFVVLWGMRRIENRVEIYQMGELCITTAEGALSVTDLRQRLENARFRIKSISITHSVAEHRQKLDCEVRWPAPQGDGHVPPVLAELELLPGLQQLEWRSIGTAPN